MRGKRHREMPASLPVRQVVELFSALLGEPPERIRSALEGDFSALAQLEAPLREAGWQYLLPMPDGSAAFAEITVLGPGRDTDSPWELRVRAPTEAGARLLAALLAKVHSGSTLGAASRASAAGT